MPECCASFSTTSHEKDAEIFDCRLLEPQSGKKKRMAEGTLPAINFRLHTPPTVELEVSVRVISVIGHGLTQQDQTSRRSHFKYHAKTQFRHFRSFWCINSLTFRGRLLWRSKLQNHGSGYIECFTYFTYCHAIFIWQKAIPQLTWRVILKRYAGGNMEHGTLG